MHRIQSKTIYFLLALVIDKEIAKTNTSFLMIPDKYFYSGLFCCSCNI